VSRVEVRRDGPSLVDGYRAVVGDGPMQMLETLAARLRGHRIVMVNSTATGGGVAEILHRLVRLLQELGVPTSWEVMPGDARFHGITKTLHNTLHGAPGALSADDIEWYHETNRRAAAALELDEHEEDALLAPLELPTRRPWVTQVSRYDRLKDPLGVIEAFRLVRGREDAHLVLAGGGADDDPEGAAVLVEVRERAAQVGGVSVLLLPSDAHLTINALQRRSAIVVQKSLREGFALTVSEALWKRRAVVASAVGGIPLQVLHERTGMLVHSIEGCAYQITRLLRAPDLRRRLGAAGREHVRGNFLHPREARDYLAVFARLVEAANGVVR